MRTEEIWHDLDRFPSHQVSSHGRVRNKKTGRILKPFSDRYGYLRVSIGNTDNVYIHRLVCETFLGEPEDGDRQNNHLSNLEWCTQRYNNNYGTRNKRMSKTKRNNTYNTKAVRCVELKKTFPSTREASRKTGIDCSQISAVCNHKKNYKTAGGYHWHYVERRNKNENS